MPPSVPASAESNVAAVSEIKTLTGTAAPEQKILESKIALAAQNDAPVQEEYYAILDPRQKTTFVDRHECSRTVPLKVLCFGLGRTGTNSLRHAFYMLGYHDAYHYSSLFENPPDLDMWLEALEIKYGPGYRPWSDRAWARLLNSEETKMDSKRWGREQWDKLLGHCMTVSDLPCLAFVPELMEAYPEAKILITVRDPDAWHRSYSQTLLPWHERHTLPRGPLVSLYRWFANPSWPLYSESALDKANHHFCRNTPMIEFAEKGKVWFNDHNEMVKRLAKEQGREVLEFDVRQGWGPLCEFLGEEVPKDRSFPNVNDSEWFRGIVQVITRMQAATVRRNMSILAAVVAGLGAVVLRWRSW